MGCHTWFRNEWKHIPKKDIKLLIEKLSKEPVNKLDTFEKYRTFMRDYYQECININDLDQAKYLLPQINSRACWKKERRSDIRRKMIKNRKISRHELISNLRHLDWVYYPDKYYDVPHTYGDDFRIYDYEAEPWYSVEDFKDYIKNNPDKRITCDSDNPYEYAISVLKQFFEEYPHGRVELG